MGRPVRICVVASSRFPLREPFAGGLESHSHALVSVLRRRGHDVTVFAAPGSDPLLRAEELAVEPFASTTTARADLAAPPEWWMREHHAYLTLMLALQRRDDIDVVHNNSLHHLPIAMAPALGVPVVTTLHTPPLPWLESAMAIAGTGTRFIAVSAAMQQLWAPTAASTVVHNGVDLDRWRPGPGGPRAVWSGRLVPEKAPHEAAAAAHRAGIGLDLVGPVGDADYVDRQLRPLLDDRVRYLGHLAQRELREVVARAAVAVVTPSWDEPFGLVAVEALACGTPVAAYRRGALPEIVDARAGVLAPPGDVPALAEAIRTAAALPREGARATAVGFGLDAMVDRYLEVYAEARGARPDAA